MAGVYRETTTATTTGFEMSSYQAEGNGFKM